MNVSSFINNNEWCISKMLEENVTRDISSITTICWDISKITVSYSNTSFCFTYRLYLILVRDLHSKFRIPRVYNVYTVIPILPRATLCLFEYCSKWNKVAHRHKERECKYAARLEVTTSGEYSNRILQHVIISPPLNTVIFSCANIFEYQNSIQMYVLFKLWSRIDR